jgi:hypothetical protein
MRLEDRCRLDLRLKRRNICVIARGNADAANVLLILSEHSIKSDWVEDEVTKAFAEERRRGQIVLFPVRLDDAVMDTSEAWAVKLRDQRHVSDFRCWKNHDAYKTSFERVLYESLRVGRTSSRRTTAGAS